MKKILVLVSSLMITGVISTCFANTLEEGKMALEKQNYFKAIEAFTKVCNDGNAEGCFQLGVLYEKGEGIAQNKYKAATYYAQACQGGNSLGCSNMSLKYDTP